MCNSAIILARSNGFVNRYSLLITQDPSRLCGRDLIILWSVRDRNISVQTMDYREGAILVPIGFFYDVLPLIDCSLVVNIGKICAARKSPLLDDPHNIGDLDTFYLGAIGECLFAYDAHLFVCVSVGNDDILFRTGSDTGNSNKTARSVRLVFDSFA